MTDHCDIEERKKQHWYEIGAKKNDANEKGIYYDGDYLKDYVKCICAAYVHYKQIGVMFFMDTPYTNFIHLKFDPILILTIAVWYW
jgi:hypothetical protein